jgi:putative transposase
VFRVARPLRIEVPGGVYHVVVRGNRRDSIFLDDADRLRFLDDLARVARRMGWEVLAYCLMGNHYHLFLRVSDAGLARGMRDLNSAFCQAFNRRHGRVGHVLQGRYKSPLVEGDRYRMALVRYILRNPVRAGLCARPGDWPWSSYGATVGAVEAPGFVATALALAGFGETPEDARQAFIAFVADDGDDPVQDPVGQLAVLGSPEFVARHADAALGLCATEITRAHRDPLRAQLADVLPRYVSDNDLLVLHREGGYAMSALARALGVHPSTVSRRIRRVEC